MSGVVLKSSHFACCFCRLVRGLPEGRLPQHGRSEDCGRSSDPGHGGRDCSPLTALMEVLA